MSLSRLLGTSGVTLGIYILYKLARFIYTELTSTIRHLPGPPNPSVLLGNLRQILDEGQLTLREKWVEKYGPTMKYRTMFMRSRLYTLDTKAINHMLTNNFIYQRSEAAGYNLKRILGEGVLLAEGEIHKNQRKILNPAFGPLQIARLTEVFFEKAIQLRAIWASQVQNCNGEAKVDVVPWLNKTTLDVIGQAGFGYDFNALSENPGHRNELSEALTVMLKAGTQFNIVALLRATFPVLRFMRSENDAKGDKARDVMLRVGKELLERAKRDHLQGSEKLSDFRVNLLSLLVHANMSADIPDHQRLSDEDVLAQIPTFIFAGHDTTSTAITWALYALTEEKEVQEKLRGELLQVSTDNPTMQELNSLPYLDMVIRETLRLHTPVGATIREVVEENVLPLETPVTDKKGRTHYDIRLKKGDKIMIPISLINRSKILWGEDAQEFRPERWSSVPQAAASIPGVWSNILTFLGGPRACIGFRFSIVEMKAILFTLIRAFEFELAVPHEDVFKKSEIVTRPALRTDLQGGYQLPVLIRPASLF